MGILEHSNHPAQFVRKGLGHKVRISPLKVFAFIAVYVSWPLYGNACGQCTASLMWRAFPPILLWQWIGIAWFLGLSLISTNWGRGILFVPNTILAGILVLLGVLAYPIAGPFFTLPFLACAILGAISAFIYKTHDSSSGYTQLVISVSLLALGAIALTGILELAHPTPRSPVDVILKWEGTVSERLAFADLKKAEPDSVESYREIVRKAQLFAVGSAARRLAVVGDSSIDVPLVIGALERTRARSDKYVALDLEDSLRKLTGLSLPERTPATEWREKWVEKEGGRTGEATE